MIIEVGKRYVRRDGNTSGYIVPTTSRAYPWWDPLYGECYVENGRWVSDEIEDHADLVAVAE